MEFGQQLRQLVRLIKDGDEQRVIQGLAHLVPEYAPSPAVRSAALTGVLIPRLRPSWET